jgi:hypothetical protein
MKILKYVLIFILGALLSGAGVFLFMKGRSQPAVSGSAASGIEQARESVEQRLAETSQDINDRLAAFAREVEGDQLFSLKLLVENNPSAPEVTNKAVQFLSPMGFSLLEIADSGYAVISSGQFPASVGNSVAAKAERLSDEPAVVSDKVMSGEVVTFQAKRTFRIAESITFYAMGGMIINEAWLKRLSSSKSVSVLLKRDNVVLGMDDVKTISEVKDSRILINDREYEAAEVPLSVAGGEAAASLIVIMSPGRP